jgi:hypothetical protein
VIERKGKGNGRGRKRRERVNDEHNIKLIYDPIGSYGK